MKNKDRERLLRTTLAVIMVLSVVTIGIAPASAASVTRGLPVCVVTNGEFEVTLTQTGFEMGVGTVVETLPAGFEYVDGSYTGGGPNKAETVTYNSTTRKLRAAKAFVDAEGNAMDSVTYHVTASSDGQNAVFTGIFATVYDTTPATIGGDQEVCVDAALPYTDADERKPAKDATGVPVDTNVTVHIRDDCYIVPTSIVMHVDGINVTSSLVLFPIGLDHYLVTYDPPENFSYDHTVVVTVDAEDCVGNAMPTDKYSFTTETGVVADSIAGRITYTCNTTGIAGVSVNLTNLTGVVKTTTTNATGYYNFTGVSPGSYSVNASKQQFWGNSTAVTVTDGAPTTANMMLWLKGDLNNDGFVNVVDIAMLRQAVAGLIASEWYFDLNDDGFVNVVDIAMLRQAVAGLIVLE